MRYSHTRPENELLRRHTRTRKNDFSIRVRLAESPRRSRLYPRYRITDRWLDRLSRRPVVGGWALSTASNTGFGSLDKEGLND